MMMMTLVRLGCVALSKLLLKFKSALYFSLCSSEPCPVGSTFRVVRGARALPSFLPFLGRRDVVALPRFRSALLLRFVLLLPPSWLSGLQFNHVLRGEEVTVPCCGLSDGESALQSGDLINAVADDRVHLLHVNKQ